MASKTLTLNKLVSSDFSEGSSWVLNKGGGGDTDVGYFVFNSLGVASAKITNVSFKINAIETGGNNLFAENIYLNFEFGRYVGSTFTKSSAFSFSRLGVKESENQVSRTATASGKATLSGDNLCIKLTITPQNNSIGSKIIMSGFSLTVTYEETPKYTVTVNVNDTNGGTVSGDGSYYSGSTATVTAKPNEGYSFKGWANQSGDITVTSNPYSFRVNANTTFYAVFEKLIYTVTWKNYDGTVLETDKGVSHGTTPTYNGSTPTKPQDAQYTYTFSGWSPSIGAITSNTEYVAQFTATKRKYTISTSVTNGTISGDGTYEYGTSVILTVTPDNGYKFEKWSDGNTQNPRTITVTGNATYEAQIRRLVLKFKSVKIYYPTKTNIASPDNPLIANEKAQIVVQISLE